MMNTPPGGDLPPRIRAGGILSALAVGLSLFWEGALLHKAAGVFDQTRVPMPGAFLLLSSVAPWGYYAAAVAAVPVLSTKDLWLKERAAQRIDAVALASAFLFYIIVEAAVKAPFLSLVQGLETR